MTIIFPPNPVIDDEFDAPNGQTYRWDGDVWVKSGDAFVNLDDYVLKAGDTMEGPLLLDAMTNDPRCAVYREWVEGLASGGLYAGPWDVATNTPDLNTIILKARIPQHGLRFLCLTDPDPDAIPPVAIPGLTGRRITNGSFIIWDGPLQQWDLIQAQTGGGLSQDLADLRYLRLIGGTLTGALNLPAPTAASHAANKAYVDSATAGPWTTVPLTGHAGQLSVRWLISPTTMFVLKGFVTKSNGTDNFTNTLIQVATLPTTHRPGLAGTTYHSCAAISSAPAGSAALGQIRVTSTGIVSVWPVSHPTTTNQFRTDGIVFMYN